jgi:hypothetical protein
MPKQSTLKGSRASKPEAYEKTSPAAKLENEGEGSRSAARRYDAGAERMASNPKVVEELAKKAEKALQGAEGATLHQAEQRGKKSVHR